MDTGHRLIPAQACPDAQESWTCGQLTLALAIAATAAAIGFGVVFAIGSRLIGGRAP